MNKIIIFRIFGTFPTYMEWNCTYTDNLNQYCKYFLRLSGAQMNSLGQTTGKQKSSCTCTLKAWSVHKEVPGSCLHLSFLVPNVSKKSILCIFSMDSVCSKYFLCLLLHVSVKTSSLVMTHLHDFFQGFFNKGCLLKQIVLLKHLCSNKYFRRKFSSVKLLFYACYWSFTNIFFSQPHTDPCLQWALTSVWPTFYKNTSLFYG
jgi:hypothetical protein